jgi:hypothetical protein
MNWYGHGSFPFSEIVILPKEILGSYQLLACDKEVKFNHGMAEKWIKLSSSNVRVKMVVLYISCKAVSLKHQNRDRSVLRKSQKYRLHGLLLPKRQCGRKCIFAQSYSEKRFIVLR